MPTTNPLQTNHHVSQKNKTDESIQSGDVQASMLPSSGPTQLSANTSNEDSDKLVHTTEQDDLISADHLRSRPLSWETYRESQFPEASLSSFPTREDNPTTQRDLIDNFNRLGLKCSPIAGEDDAYDWWTQSQQLVTHPMSVPLQLQAEERNATNKRRRMIRSLKDSALRAERRGELARSAEIWYRYHMKQHRSNQKRIEQRIGADDQESLTSEEPALPIAGTHVSLAELHDYLRISVDDFITTESFEQVLQQVRTAYAAPNDWTDSSANVQAALTSGNLCDYDWKLISEDERLYLQHGLQDAILNKQTSLRYLGLPREQLITYLQTFPELSPSRLKLLMEMLDQGGQPIMKSTWQPNGGIAFQQTKSYASHKRLCAHEFTVRHAEGRLFMIRESILTPEDRSKLHYSPLTIAQKLDKKHRVCHHLSKSTDNKVDNSYNEGIDMDKHRTKYEFEQYPTLADLCTMACQMHDVYPEATRLDMNTTDIRTAYNQEILAYGKCLYMVTRLDSIEHPTEPMVAISLVGVFGDKVAGELLTAPFSQTIRTLHNSASMSNHLRLLPGNKRLSRSDIYVDDLICFAPGIQTTWSDVDTRTYPEPGGILTTRPGITNSQTLEIHRTVIDARTIIHNILGRQAMKEDKVQTYLGGGVAIGWDFDLRYSHFRVGPKREALLKMVYALFVSIPTHLGPLTGGTYDKDENTGA
jgi:hypothetical protein